MLRNLSQRLLQSGFTLVIGSVKRQVLNVMQRTGLTATDKAAIESLLARIDRAIDDAPASS